MMKLKITIIFLLASLPLIAQSAVPDFSSFKDVKQKKAAFFNYMYPLILAENKKIMTERMVVSKGENSAELTRICKKYSKKKTTKCNTVSAKKLKDLMLRIDAIPPSLVMAQAANESAWGTSRFAKKANNYFGQWCFKKGCGIVPSKRNKGDKQEVKKFKNPRQSVSAYLFNLNSGRVYNLVRTERANARAKSINPTGYEMAKGLIKYSQRREAYVKEIRSMISFNKLVKKYDVKFWKELSQ